MQLGGCCVGGRVGGPKQGVAARCRLDERLDVRRFVVQASCHWMFINLQYKSSTGIEVAVRWLDIHCFALYKGLAGEWSRDGGGACSGATGYGALPAGRGCGSGGRADGLADVVRT